MEVATKDKWQTNPMSKPHKLDVTLTINETEFRKLKPGFVPASMDDKWFVYYDGGGLHIHRSWTGAQIFKCKVTPGENGEYLINEVFVERDSDVYNEIDDKLDLRNFQSHIRYLTQREISNPIIDGVLGLVVGDALGVPVEFVSRKELKENPVSTMTGFGTHNQPVGTWSDDSSMTLCLAEILVQGLDYHQLGKSFVEWLYNSKWTPHGKVFDVGISTRLALDRIRNGETPEFAGNVEESSNGNGSLMRILPLFIETRKLKKLRERYDLIKKVSSITHAHVRSCLACFYYLEMATFLSYNDKYPIKTAYEVANNALKDLTIELEINPDEVKLFERLTNGNLGDLKENQIYSSGYVLHTLEAAVWCLLNTNSYKEAVLKAVNLGEDTDTVGAVTGGLAGMFYGRKSIPDDWVKSIARLAEIEELLGKLSDRYKLARC